MVWPSAIFERTGMAADEPDQVIYWDASAILSVLFADSHSEPARKLVHSKGIHLMSTLSHAEVCAVMARFEREGVLADGSIQTTFEVLTDGPWRRLTAWPDWKVVQSLSGKWPLRGADLWHLATAKSLQSQLPELHLLTFDERLQKAVEGEDLQIR